MRTREHVLGTIYIPGPDDRLDALYALKDSAPIFAADTETTGLNMYAEDFKVRIVQCGTKGEAWILRPEWHATAINDMLTQGEVWWHHRFYDLKSIEQSMGLDFDAMADVARDTEILSRLIDPRPAMLGGTGHTLGELGVYYLGTDSKKTSRTALHEAWGRGNKVKIADIFKHIPIDNEAYEIYAGQDVFLTARAADVLQQRIRARHLERFVTFEHQLSRRVSMMERIGMPFDYEWADVAEAEYMAIFEQAEKELIEQWKVEPDTATYAHTAKRGLITCFERLGVKKWAKWTAPTDRYPTGQISLDKAVLEGLAKERGDVGKVATTVLHAKQNKHYADYIALTRELVGKDGRIHPSIRTMAATTHRMSISDPPLQQFPRGDPRPRGCMLADPGEIIICIDMDQIEFRIAAAVSQDPVMIKRIVNGQDLHEVTATALFGPGFNKDQRQASKAIGFGRLYLGGANGILAAMRKADTTGYVPSLLKVKKAIKAFDTDYCGYYRWAVKRKSTVEGNNGFMVTATGRELFVEPSYAAPNYEIQSVARDIFAAGINKAHKMGLGDRLRLVVHDEIVASVPRDRAAEYVAGFEEALSTVFRGVPLSATGEEKGIRWAK